MVALLAAGVAGLFVAAVAVRPLLRDRVPTRLLVAAAAGAAIALTGPTIALEVAQTARFRTLGLTDAGVPRNQEPPADEEAVAALQQALRPGETWAVRTADGACDPQALAYQWLAFRLHPAEPDCAGADVRLLLGAPAPPEATVVARGETYAVVR